MRKLILFGAALVSIGFGLSVPSAHANPMCEGSWLTPQ
jgi:hypothetical protein